MEKPRVLVLDDEPGVLSAVRRVLRNEPWEIGAMTSPVDALNSLETGGWDVLLSDYRMPEMDGIAVMERSREISPDTVRIMFSGVADVKIVIDAINRGAVYRMLEKPWNDDVLRVTLRQAVELCALVRARRRAEEEKRRAEVNRVMLESLGAACHHLGQPATVLQTSLWLLAKQISEQSPEIERLMGECVSASTRIGELLRRLNEINEYRAIPYLSDHGDGPESCILDIE